MIPKLKISSWSVNPKRAKDLEDAGYTVLHSNGMVHLTLLKKRGNGECWRMRIDMTEHAAEELIKTLSGEDEPDIDPPKKNWWQWNE